MPFVHCYHSYIICMLELRVIAAKNKEHHHGFTDYTHTVYKYGYACCLTGFLVVYSTNNLIQCVGVILQLFVMLKWNGL